MNETQQRRIVSVQLGIAEYSLLGGILVICLKITIK